MTKIFLRLFFIVFSLTSCNLEIETSKVSYVNDVTSEQLVGEWEFSTKFSNERMVKDLKPEYLEFSKTDFDLKLNADNSISILRPNETKTGGNWKILTEPEKFTNLKTTWLELRLENDYEILTGRYYLTQNEDSIYMLKKIWEDFDSSGELRFKRAKKL